MRELDHQVTARSPRQRFAYPGGSLPTMRGEVHIAPIAEEAPEDVTFALARLAAESKIGLLRLSDE